MFRICLMSFLLLMASAVPEVQAEELPQLDLYTEHNPPLADVDRDSSVFTGINVEIARELMRVSAVPYRFRYAPFKRARRTVLETKNSCLVGAIVTQEREARFSMVKPMTIGGWALFKRADSDIELSKLADAAPFTIGATNGYPATKYLKSQGKFKVMMVPDSSSQLEMLINGRVDLALSGINFVRQFDLPRHVERPVVAFMVRQVEVGLACNRATSQEIIARLRAHLPEIEGFIEATLRGRAGTD